MKKTCCWCENYFRSEIISQKYCDATCKARAHYHHDDNKEYFVCTICEEVFKGSKYTPRKTCSKKCQEKSRQKNYPLTVSNTQERNIP